MKRFVILTAVALGMSPAAAQNFVTHQSPQTDALGNPAGGLAGMLGAPAPAPAPQGHQISPQPPLIGGPDLPQPHLQPAPALPSPARAYPRQYTDPVPTPVAAPVPQAPEAGQLGAQARSLEDVLELYPNLGNDAMQQTPAPVAVAPEPAPRYQPYQPGYADTYPRQYAAPSPAPAEAPMMQPTQPAQTAASPIYEPPPSPSIYEPPPSPSIYEPPPSYPTEVVSQPYEFGPIPVQEAPPPVQTFGGAVQQVQAPPVYSAPPPVTDQSWGASVVSEPQIYAAAPPARPAEPSFQEESETSRRLLAMEDQYNAAIRKLEARKQATKMKLLDQFEKDATDPNKVVGLADRLRKAMATLDEVHAAALADEEKRYNTARLDLLAASPSRLH